MGGTVRPVKTAKGEEMEEAIARIGAELARRELARRNYLDYLTYVNGAS